MAREIERGFILSEIKRCADANGGKPLGRDRFLAATGITPSEVDRHFVRWNDALIAAGYEANAFQGRVPDDVILDKLAHLVRDLGHVPVKNELRQRSQIDPTFPNDKTFLTRFGGKAQLLSRLLDYTQSRAEWSDVTAIVAAQPTPATPDDTAPTPAVTGFVYLMKSGKHHKIGRSNSTGRRSYEVGLLMPESLVLVHEIATDDPVGIEQYWHQRFADRRTRGEWFNLTRDDIAAFKRRKFM